MNLRIIKAGLLDTVQDLGRYGWQHEGINPGGAMDKTSAQIANLLVGNEKDDAVIELHFPASSFFFEQPTLIAISGGDFEASINGDEVPNLHPILVSKYSILQFHKVKSGARAYLAIAGGLEIKEWLGSYSTHLKANVGGHLGRALQKDDEIRFKRSIDFCPLIGKQEYMVLPWSADTNWLNATEQKIQLLKGKDWDLLTADSQAKISQQGFNISFQSDRMGFHLQGEPLQVQAHTNIISSGVKFGTIQLLPGGQLIVLMADHQTTGGYPSIAYVATGCLGQLAQKRPGELIRFEFCDLHTAEQLLVKQNQHLLQLQNACTFRLQETLHV